MILLDRDVVIELGLWESPFRVQWNLNDPVEFAEGAKVDWASPIAPGPFLLVVHDENAWAGQAGHLYMVAGKRHDPINLRWWQALADLYAESMGISRQGLVLRFSAIERRLRKQRGEWLRWRQVYHWPEGGDLAWSALMYGHHPSIKAREHVGEREVRYAG